MGDVFSSICKCETLEFYTSILFQEIWVHKKSRGTLEQAD